MRKPRLIDYVMISPAQFLLTALIFLPAVYVFWLSLTKSSFGVESEFVGFQNYVYVFSDPVFWRALVNTFVVVNVAVYGELALGMALGVLMIGWVPLKKLVISLLMLPYAVTQVSAVVMWRFLFEPDVGAVNYALTQIGLGQIQWAVNPVHALALVTVLSVWRTLPFSFMILYSALKTVPSELVEAATVDGASGWQVFWRIKFGTIIPAVLVALLFRYIFALRLFAEVWLLTEGGPARLTEVLAVYLYRHGFRYHEFGVAATTGWIMLLLSVLIAFYYLKQMHKRMFSND